ncbi:MAG: DegV family protein, partial [Candidatus Saccharimonadales bacterium]
VLLKAGVVDAGAQGFLDLLEGIGAFLHGEAPVHSTRPIEVTNPLTENDHDAFAESHPEHRWCSECLVMGKDLELSRLRTEVAALGASCVVVAGSTTRMRVHAHVAQPQILFEAVARFGRVESTKADDMHAQSRAAAADHAVAVITDSAADLPDGVAEALNLHVVPLRLNFGDEDYLDKVGMTPAQFYNRLRESDVLPRTSQPAPGDFRRQFEFLLSHHDAVVYVGVSRVLSGTIQSAETAAQRVTSDRIVIVDSINAAGGQALLAMAAAGMAMRGDDAEHIKARLDALRTRTQTWAMTRDMTMVVRGGRLPAWSKTVVDGLRLTPIARFKSNGKLSVVSGMFGKQRLPERFAAHVARHVERGQRWRVIVGHCAAAEDGATVLSALRARLNCSESWLVETGPAVGAHAGPSTLVVSLQPVEA